MNFYHFYTSYSKHITCEKYKAYLYSWRMIAEDFNQVLYNYISPKVGTNASTH